MWPYWFIFLIPASAAATGRRLPPATVNRAGRIRDIFEWLCMALILWLMIGFRHEVGGDWFNYLGHYYNAQQIKFIEVLEGKDPGYYLLNWISAKLGLGVQGTNLMSGALFSVGLVTFCRSLPRPWLALSVSVPYLVIVVAMGYSRQGVALGLSMLGLVALVQNRTPWFVFWIVLGATFHKSAILLLPIAALAATRNRYWTAFWVGIIGAGAYYLLLEDSVESLYAQYVEAQYQSQGALIRLLMNVIPAGILLLLQRRFHFLPGERMLWRWFAIISLVLLAVFWLTPASTAVDRVALYMLPLQPVVFSYFPGLFGRRGSRVFLLTAAVLLYYGLVLFVWLNYASHASYWLPYRFYPLELL